MPAWPGTLPAAPLLAGLSENYDNFNASFEPDVGLPSTWPRSTASKLTTPVQYNLTTAQKNTLTSFWKSDCKTGSVPFTWTDPVHGGTITMKFSAGLRFSAQGGAKPWRVEFELIRLA